MSHQYKTLVVDFDDTLAFHTNRDFDNARPNVQLISKLQRLYNEGWYIKIVTARGSISCKTREEAFAKYGDGMLTWLKKHNVAYHELSFDKPLAAYYIDDKGITPDDFIHMKIEPLKGGLSGSDIYTDGKFVHKIDKQANLTNTWFLHAKSRGINVPEIYRIVGDSITMEYIDHDPIYLDKRPLRALALVIEALNKMSQMPMISNDLTKKSYKDRINAHGEASGIREFKDIGSFLPEFHMKKSFSHGDFGCTNMLFKDGEMYLIDPLPNVYGCTLIDSAKFIASLYINKKSDTVIKYAIHSIMYFNNITWDVFKHFIAAEALRVYKYHPDKDFMKLVITDVLK